MGRRRGQLECVGFDRRVLRDHSSCHLLSLKSGPSPFHILIGSFRKFDIYILQSHKPLKAVLTRKAVNFSLLITTPCRGMTIVMPLMGMRLKASGNGWCTTFDPTQSKHSIAAEGRLYTVLYISIFRAETTKGLSHYTGQ